MTSLLPRAMLFAGAMLVAAACGSAEIGSGPCDDSNPPPQCTTECGSDGDCPLGFYCGPAPAPFEPRTCTADCTPGGNECRDGEVCNDKGRCVPDSSVIDADVDRPDGDLCPSVVVDLEPVTPTVVVLIDQSGSMTEAFGGTDRWTAVRQALTDPGGVVEQLEDDVYFGASLYTNDNSGACPDLTSVPPAISNHGAIQMLLQNNSPSADTPTGESIDVVVADLMANPPPPDSPPIIVVATDGEPDTCAEPNPQNGQPEAVAAAMNSYANGVELFILSVGSGVSDQHLQDMANAGVGLPVGGPTDAPFYVANNQQEMIDAFNDIIGGVRSCEITVDGNIDPNRADEGNVELNGTMLDFGTDWELVDTNTIRLLGDACDEFLTTPNVELTAEFPCGVVIP